MKKRIFALLLAVITVLSAYPVYSLTASAQGEEEPEVIEPAVIEPAGSEAEELIPQDTEEEYVSEEEYEEEIEESSAPPALFSVTPYAAETGEDDTTTISDEAFQISIKYVYRHDNPSTALGEFDGTRAANPFTVSLPIGGFYSGTVATPLEVGYLPYVKIEDKDYALFFRDISEDYEKYEGKTVRFTGIIAKDDQVPKNLFVIGRHVMTCCEADIQYCGLACELPAVMNLQTRDWIRVTAKVEFKKHRIYKGKGPVLTAEKVVVCDAPDEQLATFY